MILEFNTYKTVSGVQAADHAATVRRVHDTVVANRPGFLRRVIAIGRAHV